MTAPPGWEKRRQIWDRGFRVVGFAATFFGLAMLLIFLVKLGVDVADWFHTMPAEVAARNLEVKQKGGQDAETFIREQLAEVERQMQINLDRAKNEDEKRQIRELYETDIIPRKRADLEKTIAEFKRDMEGVRTNISPPALLGHFLTHGPSDQPEEAGILPALLGSIWLAALTLILAVPLGVGAAVYLEEYRHSGWLNHIIQTNINNLAGVPSIVFGILGAFVFVDMIFRPLDQQAQALMNDPAYRDVSLNLFQQTLVLLTRQYNLSARNVLAGGMTLALLTLPVIIVSAQEAIRAVPMSLRHGAYALGATRWQVTRNIVLPSATPGILTGTILGLSRAIGEAAPLIFMGAQLYVNQLPTLFSRFTILPLQIFDWADRPQNVWRYNAALASVVLLLTLLAMNGAAIYLRQRAHGKPKD